MLDFAFNAARTHIAFTKPSQRCTLSSHLLTVPSPCRALGSEHVISRNIRKEQLPAVGTSCAACACKEYAKSILDQMYGTSRGGIVPRLGWIHACMRLSSDEAGASTLSS